jgi:molybdate transport system substrate-binding protein
LHAFRAAVVAVLLLSGPATAQEEAPVIAAAANLDFAIAEIAARFTRETGMDLRISLGSTGNIARQVRQGAPFELFLAADDATVLALHADGLTRDAGVVYAVGRLALVAPHGGRLDPMMGLDGLAELLAAGGITRFSIANPDHAPFGIAARQALVTRELWAPLQPFLVLGENVSQATQFALSGSADGGIVAYSLALAPQVQARGSHALIPEELHAPLRQRMALLPEAGPVAEAFFDYLQSPPAQAILESYGFALPEG